MPACAEEAPAPPTLPLHLCLRAALFADFAAWATRWRPVCRGAALPPEWYAENCSPGCVCFLRAEGSRSGRFALQAAVDAFLGPRRAPAGGTEASRGTLPVLVLLPGQHKGPLFLDRPCLLVAWGAHGAAQLVWAEAPRTATRSGSMAALHLGEGASGARICNLHVQTAKFGWAAAIDGGVPAMAGCSIQGGGVTLRGGAPQLDHCTVSGSDGDAVLVEVSCGHGAGLPLLRSCTITGARIDGVSLDTDAQIEGCTISGNGRHGVRLDADLKLSKSDLQRANCIHDNAQRMAWGEDVCVELFAEGDIL
uniref:Right handed beta helix domain-containing protein n=1 Tax=Alexandrium monilatum TaxID=311494 RepID=A0A7S4W7Y4_9DINO